MTTGAKKMRDFHNQVPNAKIHQQEFWLMEQLLERWKNEGHINDDTNLDELFGFDEAGNYQMNVLGWCETAFFPQFPVKILEDRGEHELVQDFAGRSVLYFKGKRSGFMPEYVDHPVKTLDDFNQNIKFRMEFETAERQDSIKKSIAQAKKCREENGDIICNNLVGGYMYLRSLMGPEGALYLFYDDPDLIHAAMEKWFELADKTSEMIQKEIDFDEVFLAEDICYNNGPLISLEMIREFLFPYYRKLFDNMKRRQKKEFAIQIDTDGDCRSVISVYQELGMTYMSPFEVASGCDVVEIRKLYPNLLMRGGIDKRILATSIEAIDAEIDRIMPFMVKFGGYIPSVDHGTPPEVSFENYMHYRKRMLEF